jgi:predicted nucleotidyltransferase
MQTKSIAKITQAVIGTASKYPCISRIGLFGSYARGDGNSESDVDLLYDYDYGIVDATQQFLSFVEDFLEEVKPLDADFVFVENLLESEDIDFKNNVLRDVIWIYNGLAKTV